MNAHWNWRTRTVTSVLDINLSTDFMIDRSFLCLYTSMKHYVFKVSERVLLCLYVSKNISSSNDPKQILCWFISYSTCCARIYCIDRKHLNVIEFKHGTHIQWSFYFPTFNHQREFLCFFSFYWWKCQLIKPLILSLLIGYKQWSVLETVKMVT